MQNRSFRVLPDGAAADEPTTSPPPYVEDPTPVADKLVLLLFCSGAAALVYQVAWFREFRSIFGASTSATAAVLALFTLGLGAGGVVFGRRIDAHPNPARIYAALEIGIALSAAATPALLSFARTQ